MQEEHQVREASFRENAKKNKNGEFHYSEGHNFLLKGLGVAAYAGELSHPLYSLKFTGRLVFENKKS